MSDCAETDEWVVFSIIETKQQTAGYEHVDTLVNC